MIELHTQKHDEYGLELKDKMKSLRLAFKTEELKDKLPVFIIDGKEKITGRADIEQWFRELEEELRIQRSITGDACYIDPETGKVC